MSKKVDDFCKSFDGLSTKEKEEVRRYISQPRRRYKKDYEAIIIKVKQHILAHGSITNIEAHDLGFSDRVIHSTTFKRCVIDKIDLDLVKMGLSNRRVAYVLKGFVPENSLHNDEDLVSNIMRRVDLTQNLVNLLPYVDSEQFPILKEDSIRHRIVQMVVREMEKNNYTLTSSRLDFERRI